MFYRTGSIEKIKIVSNKKDKKKSVIDEILEQQEKKKKVKVKKLN